MTSSLVGSEMCIRDRAVQHDAGDLSTGGDHKTAGFLTSCAVNAVRTMTVSYTHLTLPTICSV
eukprot:4767623-Prorocentrum_lima.AAC.1